MPKILKSRESELPTNNTVKLTDDLRARVAKAMEAGGFTVWSEFCRVALTEKCQTVEREARERDPDEYARIFGKLGHDGKFLQDGKAGPDGKTGHDGKLPRDGKFARDGR